MTAPDKQYRMSLPTEKQRAVVSLLGLLLLSLGAAQAAESSGTTTMTFGVSHGTQVEYLAADGRTYLWYPGNQVLLNGAWRYAPVRTAAATLPGICFRYGAQTFNPSTGATGSRWECEPLAIYRRGIVEAAPGDIFGLGRRTLPPFELSRERTTLRALREQVR